MFFDLNDCSFSIINRNLLPFSLRALPFKSDNISNLIHSIDVIKNWLSSRTISLSRDNFKQLCALFQLKQEMTLNDKIDLCIKCRAVSISDSYWIAYNETEVWDDFNLRKKHFADIVGVALYGESPSFTTSYLHPDLTTKGLFRKAWVRDGKKTILLKSDKTIDKINTKMEVLASDILDCTNVNHVHYVKSSQAEEYVSQVDNFIVDENLSFVPASDLMEWCNSQQIDFKDWLLQNYRTDVSNMLVIDFVLMNTDRHLENYGFFMNNVTGKLECFAPLFDFNLALVSDVLNKSVEDTISQTFMDGATIYDNFQIGLQGHNLKFNLEKIKNMQTEFPTVLEAVINRIRKVKNHLECF